MYAYQAPASPAISGSAGAGAATAAPCAAACTGTSASAPSTTHTASAPAVLPAPRYTNPVTRKMPTPITDPTATAMPSQRESVRCSRGGIGTFAQYPIGYSPGMRFYRLTLLVLLAGCGGEATVAGDYALAVTSGDDTCNIPGWNKGAMSTA